MISMIFISSFVVGHTQPWQLQATSSNVFDAFLDIYGTYIILYPLQCFLHPYPQMEYSRLGDFEVVARLRELLVQDHLEQAQCRQRL
jgi:hypothetical protein